MIDYKDFTYVPWNLRPENNISAWAEQIEKDSAIENPYKNRGSLHRKNNNILDQNVTTKKGKSND